MSRIEPVSRCDLDPALRPVLDTGSSLFAVMLHSPGASKVMSQVGHYLRRDSPLDPRLRELAILQVGHTTLTEYEWIHHVELSLDRGWLTSRDVEAVRLGDGGTSGELTTLDRMVLAAAGELTEYCTVSEGTFAALQEWLPRDQLVDLFFTIGFYNMVARILHTFDIELEEGYEELQAMHPLSGDGMQRAEGVR